MLDRDTQNVDMLVRTLDVHMLEGTLGPPQNVMLLRFGSFAFGFGPTLRVRFRSWFRSSGRVRLRTPALWPLSFCVSFCRLDGRIGFWSYLFTHFCSPFRICFPVWVLVSIVLWHLSFVCPYVVPVSSPFFSLPLTGGVKRFVSPIRSLLVWLLLG